jgi:hypothetical protein
MHDVYAGESALILPHPAVIRRYCLICGLGRGAAQGVLIADEESSEVRTSTGPLTSVLHELATRYAGMPVELADSVEVVA